MVQKTFLALQEKGLKDVGGRMISWSQKDVWVGVFDILGFKNLIRQTDREFPRALLTSKLNDLFEELDHDVMQHGQLEYMVFSDTTVIFTPDLEARSYVSNEGDVRAEIALADELVYWSGIGHNSEKC